MAVADFNGVHVPEDALLARGPALAQALEAAIGEAVLLGACQLLGIASGALELTLDYLRTRTQFGKPIGSFQALQHASVDVALQQALARAACRNALRQHAETPHSPATRAAISAAWIRFSRCLVCGNTIQHSALKKSCRFSRVGTWPVSKMNCS